MGEKLIENGTKYVTYKSLIASLASMFGIVILIFGLYIAHSEKKVNKELYDRDYRSLCTDVEKIKETVESNQRDLNRVARNQELVLRALKIEPVK
jgi:hypothetical protein